MENGMDGELFQEWRVTKVWQFKRNSKTTYGLLHDLKTETLTKDRNESGRTENIEVIIE